MGPVPLSALADGSDTLRALLALSVDPKLAGILISGASGTGKSTWLSSYGHWISHWVWPGVPVVSLPVSVDGEGLDGGLDLQRTLVTGRPHWGPSLLQRARGGLLIVDHADLLDRHHRQRVTQVLEGGGGSDLGPPFVVVAAAEADETVASLSECLALHVNLSGDGTRKTQSGWAVEPPNWEAWSGALEGLARTVRGARTRLSEHPWDEELLSWSAQEAARRGVLGHRAVVFACRAARAFAALENRAAVDDEARAFAVRLVLEPRRGHPSSPRGPESSESVSAGSEESAHPGDQPEAAGSALRSVGSGDAQPIESPLRPIPSAASAGSSVDLATWLRGITGRGTGRSASQSSVDRGRHVRSRPRRRGRRLALAATLRNAALGRDGLTPASGDLAISVKPKHLVYRELKSPAGTLFVIAVDGSGSMARHRLAEAKGLAIGFLAGAYQRRDAVSLIAFQGSRAHLLLPPTQALAQARRQLEVLPAGGGTPLAAALEEILRLQKREVLGRNRPLVAVLLTDGGANVGRDSTVLGSVRCAAELEALAGQYRGFGLRTVVVDTTPTGGGDRARRLALRLGAEWVRL